MPYDMVEGDTGTQLTLSIKDQAGAPVDLTGSTVVIKWSDVTGAPVTRNCVIQNASLGIVTYKFAAGEIYAPSMSFGLVVTASDGTVNSTTDLLVLSVRKNL